MPGGGGFQGGQLCFDAGPVCEQLGEPGADAVAEGLGGGVGRVNGGFQLGDEGALGYVDLGELLPEAVGALLAALVGGGGAGGEGGGEHSGPAGAEHPFGEEPGEGVHHEVFTDADGAVAGVGGMVAGVAWLVRAPVIGDFPDGGAAEAAVADGAVQAGPELVTAAGPPGGHFGVTDVAVPAAHLLGLVPGGLVHKNGMGGLGCPDPLLRRGPDLLAAFAAAAAHHLVPGVLGVGQDLIDQGQRPPGGGAGGRVGVRVGGQPCPDGRLAQMFANPPAVNLADDRPVDGIFDEPRFGAAFGGLDGVGVRVSFPEVADGGLPRFHPSRECSFSPSHTLPLSWSRYHSATPCFTRRTRTVVALIPSMLNGSSVANSGIPWSWSSLSSFSELYMLRALRSMSSQTTNAKSGVGDFAWCRRPAIPPSRGMPAAAATCQASECPRSSRSSPPDSTSQ